ncbi:MAG: MmgE/PrpD family protein [Actinophytocola sp.]|uniref:MmgE/PrpD family protein n=1 Tax=Actinophytocola sp. TaxID=1872138 RepID=UPI0013266E7E|nr:MmgE/PrpD family protein [Actinophytocola sp.]MPZ80093.1 MmgE/PrpD family protein [Actinophytocola sp.]
MATKRSVTESGEATALIAEYVSSADFEAIPDDVREATKLQLLDTVGVSLAAARLAPGIREISDLLVEWGGAEEATVWGSLRRLPTWAAAFVNGAMGHGLDYDTTFHDALVHPSAPVIPAAVALAEQRPGTSGKELLTALVVAQDVMSRLALSISRRESGWKFDWHNSVVFGAFGAVAGAARVTNLNAAQVESAFGIAATMSTGTMELAYGTDSDLRLNYNAFPSKAGVMAALLAERGLQGTRGILEGKAGIYNVYYEGEYDRSSLVDGLGKRFRGGQEIGYKPWPACIATHPYIDSTIQLCLEHDIAPSEVRQIEARVGNLWLTLCEPLADRQAPRSVNDAKYSIPFAIAVALLRRAAPLSDFTEQGIRNPSLLDIAAKVAPKYDRSLDTLHRTSPGGVLIHLSDGRVLSKTVEFAYGDPRAPMSTEDVVAKFRDCVDASGMKWSGSRIDRVTDLILNLEKVGYTKQLGDALGE